MSNARIRLPSASRPEISRRDFLNGLLLASAGYAINSQSAPIRLLAAEIRSGGMCDGSIGVDPRALRGGNLPAAFNIAHWLRDRRLRFESGAVTLSPGCDAYEGNFPILEKDAPFDVIIVGAGLSGLSAAFLLLRRRPGTRILVLDANARTGGNAGCDDSPPLPVVASTAGAYCAAPDSSNLKELYRELGITWEKFRISDPMYSYYFDSKTPGVKAGHRGWNIDTYDKGLKNVPYSQRIVRDLIRCRTDFLNWADKDGAPTDPPDRSSPRYDYLSAMTLDAYLTKQLNCDPIVSDFYTRYTADCLGGSSQDVSAHSAISFLSSDYSKNLFAFPGGTSELSQRLVRWLAKVQNRYWHPPDIRLNAIALRVDAELPGRMPSVSVTYFSDNSFQRATARAAILAIQSSSARQLVDHLIDDTRRESFGELTTVPTVVANVAVRTATPFVELGLGYNQYFWGSRYWADFVIADWTTKSRGKLDRPTVLTFYGGNTAPPGELLQERMKLLQTPFVDYENSLKDDLSRLMSGTKFDFDRDVTSVYIYRWGHSMILPTTRSIFGSSLGKDGRLDRHNSPRYLARRPIGPISFAGQDSEGTPSVESATGSGFRAAVETLAHL